jgi:hypothetical protein
MDFRFAAISMLIAIAPPLGTSAALADRTAADEMLRSEFAACQHVTPSGLETWLAQPFYAAEPDFSSLNRAKILATVPSQSDFVPPSWQPASSQSPIHEEIWAKAGLELAEGGMQLRILRRSNHWASVATSYVAVRTPDGIWVVTAIGIDNYRSKKYENVHTAKQYRLSESDSLALDALIADPCLKAEPTVAYYSFSSSSENPVWTLEASDPSIPVMERSNQGYGRTALINSLLLEGRN